MFGIFNSNYKRIGFLVDLVPGEQKYNIYKLKEIQIRIQIVLKV